LRYGSGPSGAELTQQFSGGSGGRLTAPLVGATRSNATRRCWPIDRCSFKGPRRSDTGPWSHESCPGAAVACHTENRHTAGGPLDGSHSLTDAASGQQRHLSDAKQGAGIPLIRGQGCTMHAVLDAAQLVRITAPAPHALVGLQSKQGRAKRREVRHSAGGIGARRAHCTAGPPPFPLAAVGLSLVPSALALDLEPPLVARKVWNNGWLMS